MIFIINEHYIYLFIGILLQKQAVRVHKYEKAFEFQYFIKSMGKI